MKTFARDIIIRDNSNTLDEVVNSSLLNSSLDKNFEKKKHCNVEVFASKVNIELTKMPV